MDREKILKWLETHPAEVHGVPADVLAHCEREVRRHAAEHAWEAAAAYVEGRMHQWEDAWGFHASESSVAKEVCILLSRELAHHEPEVGEGDLPRLAGEKVLTALEPAARSRVEEWVQEVAREVEHRIWSQIVRFTRGEGRALIAAGRVSTADDWESGENYAGKAAHVAQLLLDDYEQQAKSL